MTEIKRKVLSVIRELDILFPLTCCRFSHTMTDTNNSISWSCCTVLTSFCAIFPEEDETVQERDQLRYERHKERERQRRLARAHPEKRSKLERDRDRDVTEKIALGLPSGGASQETLFDQRLFNQSKVQQHTCIYVMPYTYVYMLLWCCQLCYVYL